MPLGFYVYLYLLVSVAGRLAGAAGESGPVVDTTSGKVAGLYTKQAQVFKSIPYARPPVGVLRWKDPLPAVPVPGILDATQDPPGCPQTLPCVLPLPQFLCPKKVSEDCLFLNIFTPLTIKPSSMLPVMVFIHGGNFLRGYSGGGLYDGQYIANSSSTVVVTINYRLGAIGFLAFGEGDDAPRGNYGLRDQRLALEWIRDNIANFGGNPDRVTLWGQSAGAVSVVLHMASVRSAGLFSKAIIESDPFSITLKDLNKAKSLGKDFAKEIGCSDVQCLYTKNIDEIAKAQLAVLTKIVDLRHVLEIFLQWTPIVDGVDVLDQPIDIFALGKVASMPVIIGTTSEETVFFIYEGFPKPVSSLELDGLELAIFGAHYKAVHEKYPPLSGQDNRPLAAVMGTQYTFSCSTRHAVWGLTNLTRAGEVKNPLWLYVFNHSMSFDWGKGFEFCNGHSCHGVELPFVFHSASMGGLNYTADELVLTNSMVEYWTTFAHTGNPNPTSENERFGQLLSWPEYRVDPVTGTKTAGYMRFKTPKSDVLTDYDSDICKFWDSIRYNV